MENENTQTVAVKAKRPFKEVLREKLPFLFNIRSLFYFFWLMVFLGFLWMASSLFINSFTQFYPWTDYFGQYVTMTHYYWDCWHNFFKTGYFELYSPNTYLGSDNIGSNAYYGLFDPFLFICYIFPRVWIPQTFAVATMFKGAVGAMAMRAYLRYMGVSESTSRVGAVAFAFNGWCNYFVGFPSFLSIAFTFPMMLLGIEKVIKEKKPTVLVFALFLLGISSFFFLVVGCIWGVIYAIWRYFWTIKQRKAKDSLIVIGLGMASFAIGILLSSWTLFPSIRESALSGRTSSIGQGYLEALKTAFKGKDFAGILKLLFEPVGRNPGREMQALQGFFYPTIGYTRLPLAASNSYDAWTSSAFCYTPMVVLFFIAMVNSIKKRKWQHIIAIVLCSYLLLTNLAYYLFYAFSGDGYGRWYIVLVPCVIFYACQELDQIKEEKKSTIFIGEFVCLALSLATWILTLIFVQNQKFDTYLDPYWVTEYEFIPNQVTRGGILHTCLWILFYQMASVLITGMVIFFLQYKKILNKLLFGIVAVETILWGNLSFFYMGTWDFDWWNGGVLSRTEATEAGEYLQETDPGYYRTCYDDIAQRNSPYIFHTNGAATFHSLYNYDLAQLNLYIHANRPDYNRSPDYAYGQVYSSKSWSAFYGHKRIGTDLALSMKYYAIRREGYGSLEGVGDNVPWGSKLVYGDYTQPYRFYRSTLVDKIPLGHAVDNVYKRNATNPENSQQDTFYSLDTYGNSNGGYKEILRNDELFLNGAILSDEDAEALTKEDPTITLATPNSSSMIVGVTGYKGTTYETNFDWWGPYDKEGRHMGANYFAELLDKSNGSGTYSDSSFNYIKPAPTENAFTLNREFEYVADKQIVVLEPTSTAFDGYFNKEWSGAYFALQYNCTNSKYKTRIYFVGDRMKENGEIEKNVLLSYEYHTMNNIIGYRIGGSGYGDIIGFYPEGRVKYICFNAKPSDFSYTKKGTFPTNTMVFIGDRSQLEGVIDNMAADDHNLLNVKYDKNKFTFDSKFTKNSVVMTSVGYDAGWHVKAKDENGLISYPKVLKVNGGLVGFVAPKGNVSYEMTYVTPYLKEAVILATTSWFLFAGYTAGMICLKIKKRKVELGMINVPVGK